MDQQINDLIKNEIDNNSVCLFMKGTPDAPQCGFSMAVSNILKMLDVKFKVSKKLDDAMTGFTPKEAKKVFDQCMKELCKIGLVKT